MKKENHVLIDGIEFEVENHDSSIINTEKAIEHLEGDVKFIGVWFVKDAKGYVFKSNNPDREKGHKDYVILKYQYNAYREDYDVVIMGYDEKEMMNLSKQPGIACKKCNTIIWSSYRHDYHGCKCEGKEQVRVDGGMDYFRYSIGEESDSFFVKINHLMKTIERSK